MKQLTLSDVIGAMSDTPKPIGDRLEALGLEKTEFEGKFSQEILAMAVYGASFLKFLQDNAGILSIDERIPAQPLPADFKNPFDDEVRSIEERLIEIGMSREETTGMFGQDVLGLKLNGDEFQTFISQNQDKFLSQLEKLATQGGGNG